MGNVGRSARFRMAAPEITGLKGEKGLANSTGLHHCFLNVVIQSLWHTRAFRERFSRLPHHHLQRAGLLHDYVGVSQAPGDGGAAGGLSSQSSDGDGDVAMITAEEQEEARLAGGQLPPNPPVPVDGALDDRDACVCCALKLIFVHYEHSDASIIPPDTLRYALSLLLDNRGSTLFRLREQSDAEEALDAILKLLHFDHIGPAGMAKLPVPPAGSAKAAESVLSRSLDCACEPACLAHQVFGTQLMDQKVCTRCGSTSDPDSASSFLYRLYVAEHIAAKRKHSGWSMEELLKHSYMQQNYSCPAATPDAPCAGPAKLHRWVLGVPEVFALQCVWSSPETERADIEALLRTIPQELHVDQFLSVQGSGQDKQAYSYRFRGMICYYGRHYMAIFYSSAFQSFVMFDDKRVSNLGDWNAVLERCGRGKLQPTVLFFETQDPQAWAKLERDIKRADAEDEDRMAQERKEAGAKEKEAAAQAAGQSASPQNGAPAAAAVAPPAAVTSPSAPRPVVAASAFAPSAPEEPPTSIPTPTRAAGDAYFGTSTQPGQRHIISIPIAAASPPAAHAAGPVTMARQTPVVIPSYFTGPTSPSQTAGAGSDEDEELQRFLWQHQPVNTTPVTASASAAASAPPAPLRAPSFGYASPSATHARRPSLGTRQMSGWICLRCSSHLPGSMPFGHCPHCAAAAGRGPRSAAEAAVLARREAFHQQQQQQHGASDLQNRPRWR